MYLSDEKIESLAADLCAEYAHLGQAEFRQKFDSVKDRIKQNFPAPPTNARKVRMALFQDAAVGKFVCIPEDEVQEGSAFSAIHLGFVEFWWVDPEKPTVQGEVVG